MFQEAERRRPGLKPGQKHSGSFRRGDDPRRAGGMKLYDGMTLAQIARLHGPRCIELWVKAMQDESVPWATRIRASELIIERGHGKAISVIDMQVTQNKPLHALTTQELEAIAAGDLPRLPVTIDGESVAVSDAVRLDAEAVS